VTSSFDTFTNVQIRTDQSLQTFFLDCYPNLQTDGPTPFCFISAHPQEDRNLSNWWPLVWFLKRYSNLEFSVPWKTHLRGLTTIPWQNVIFDIDSTQYCLGSLASSFLLQQQYRCFFGLNFLSGEKRDNISYLSTGGNNGAATHEDWRHSAFSRRQVVSNLWSSSCLVWRTRALYLKDISGYDKENKVLHSSGAAGSVLTN
jgi:hypothetical protein